MKINMLLYGSTFNPSALPATWPAQVKVVADNAPVPDTPWLEKTLADYQAYVVAHQAEYDAWAVAQQTAKDSNIATLANQYDAAMTALSNYDGISSPTNAQVANAVKNHNTILMKLLPLLRSLYLQSLQ